MPTKFLLGCGILAPLLYLISDGLAALAWNGYSYLAGPFMPMHLREVLASGGGTVTDVLHIALASVDVLLIVCILIFGSGAFGRAFRIYSRFTILTVLVFGAWAGLDGPNIQANLPTPWAGLRERISIFAFMAWVVVLAGSLLTRFGSKDAHQAEEGESWERLYWIKPSSPTPPLRRG